MGLEWNYMIDMRSTWANATMSANWEQAVRTTITWILGTDSGKLLLNSIRFFGKWVVISPYDGSQGACNAVTDARAGTARDGRAYGATVLFSPHMYNIGSTCHGAAPNNRGNMIDEVLHHELVHAFRRVSGKRARVETSGGLMDYDSNEEFHAILVTNIYISDPSNKIKTGLLRDHQASSRPLQPELASSLSFFESSMNTFSLISQFCTDHPVLSRALAKVPAPFNPLAAFFANPAEARRRSLSARAVIRDADGWATAIGRFVTRLLP